jgi:Protein of unknown function (DUF2934)
MDQKLLHHDETVKREVQKTGVGAGTSKSKSQASVNQLAADGLPHHTRLSFQSAADVPHSEIAHRAYDLYVHQGCPTGQDEQTWLLAEQQVKEEYIGAADSQSRDYDTAPLDHSTSAPRMHGTDGEFRSMLASRDPTQHRFPDSSHPSSPFSTR